MNVVFGMSLVTILAFDLPKFITREPPPCICVMKKKSKPRIKMIGPKVNSSVTSHPWVGTSEIWPSGGGTFSTKLVSRSPCGAM